MASLADIDTPVALLRRPRGSRRARTARPTFEALREQGELKVLNPESGARFSVSLRAWQGALWAIRIRPQTLRPVDWENPFVTQHRLMSRCAIEGWLETLRLP